jgi:hypothetical protein
MNVILTNWKILSSPSEKNLPLQSSYNKGSLIETGSDNWAVGQFKAYEFLVLVLFILTFFLITTLCIIIYVL